MQAGVDEHVLVVVGLDQVDRHRDLDMDAVVDPRREDGSLVDPQPAGVDHVQAHEISQQSRLTLRTANTFPEAPLRHLDSIERSGARAPLERYLPS